MPAEENRVTVRFMPEFERNIRDLLKRYRRLLADVQPVVDQLRAGELPGERIQGVGHEVYKTRARNRDAGRGKSGGYRLLYLVREPSTVVLITLYSKSDVEDIGADRIRRMIAEYDQSLSCGSSVAPEMATDETAVDEGA